MRQLSFAMPLVLDSEGNLVSIPESYDGDLPGPVVRVHVLQVGLGKLFWL